VTDSSQTAIERALDEGFRTGAAAQTTDGIEVTIISHPYTDGQSILILGRTNPDDPGSWKEFLVEELVIQEEKRTPK
jgi:hypothetical protein